jgi:hypothetical protein
MFRSIIILAAAAATISGCGHAAYSPSLVERRQAAVLDLKYSTLEPFEQWMQESPRTCASPDLKRARESVLGTANALTSGAQGYDVVLAGAGWVLQVADGARDSGCKQEARTMYDGVIAIYVGSGYSGVRHRAQNGIDDLRSMPAAVKAKR